MKFIHEPVLVEELLQHMPISEMKLIIDATIGLGGHARHFLSKTDAHLVGIDLDRESLRIAEDNLIAYAGRITLVEDNFRNIKEIAERLELESIDFICADLGLSSFQLNCEKRGFSFTKDGPLDMRYSDRMKADAANLVNNLGYQELVALFRKYGEEPRAHRIAEEILRERRTGSITSTMQLAEIIRRAKAKRSRKHDPATLVFQALRIAVNEELENLTIFLRDAFDVLNRRGYLAIIAYHSLEDRIVKTAFRQLAARCRCELSRCSCEGKPVGRLVNKKVIKPSREEIIRNPQARSAKLRIIEKISHVQFPQFLAAQCPDRHILFSSL
ncbi:MAG: 16S rRNA (cytosine(1402)-N(4))-methyltransferase [Candidatus Fischerbacteria bacterium RBG_13_37_8]|uniref:Ribosomal RNA small subunit methyltransferase H n=1 Tax=Candidatus Fischerbacteria bacterium RBG_13_37_8 TaxID=1817863 RepID=A0A1F5VFZ7_9BACT|nr:MAG: 16S rRNA (cytosine(1402)-N(4))-methyltransferase [Candidatus Fischerbacteria bacterium RBG_13_37_8]